jgi:hypothetical protein
MVSKMPSSFSIRHPPGFSSESFVPDSCLLRENVEELGRKLGYQVMTVSEVVMAASSASELND